MTSSTRTRALNEMFDFIKQNHDENGFIFIFANEKNNQLNYDAYSVPCTPTATAQIVHQFGFNSEKTEKDDGVELLKLKPISDTHGNILNGYIFIPNIEELIAVKKGLTPTYFIIPARPINRKTAIKLIDEAVNPNVFKLINNKVIDTIEFPQINPVEKAKDYQRINTPKTKTITETELENYKKHLQLGYRGHKSTPKRKNTIEQLENSVRRMF